jgi:redox-sensitive bicupin YhaK (pirin superfamily)
MLPRAARGTNRTLYFFRGDTLMVGSTKIRGPARVHLRADADALLEAHETDCEMLLLQGRPIGEPVVAHGPFVMNTRAEIQRAFEDYQRTRFGGWPWPADGPVHARDEARFAKHDDGYLERPDESGADHG